MNSKEFYILTKLNIENERVKMKKISKRINVKLNTMILLIYIAATFAIINLLLKVLVNE